jgi:hypothetical protein
VDDVVDSASHGVWRFVLIARHVEPHRHQRRRLEARARVLQVQKAANEQRRADQKNQRQRNLGDDERAAQTVAAATRARTPAAVFQ